MEALQAPRRQYQDAEAVEGEGYEEGLSSSPSN